MSRDDVHRGDVMRSAFGDAIRKATIQLKAHDISPVTSVGMLLPTDDECKQLRRAGLLGGVALTWVSSAAGCMVWYARRGDQLPRRIGSLRELLHYLDGLSTSEPMTSVEPCFSSKPARLVRLKTRKPKRRPASAGRR